MKKFRLIKPLGITAMAGLLVATLASCGGGSNTGTSTNTGTTPSTPKPTQTQTQTQKPTTTPGTTVKPQGGDKTIVFYHTMGEALRTVLDTAVEEFEKAYPGWKVEHAQIGSYDDVKSAVIGDLQAGTTPDLAYCYADHVAQYITTSKVVDLKTYINDPEVGYSQEEIADFVQGYYKEGLAPNFADYDKYGYSQDSMLTLPYSKSTEVLYYNADALKALGYDKAPETWDELWSMCEKALDYYPLCTPLGYDSEANWFITMCEQNGWGYTSAESGKHFLFNNENTLAWLEDLQAKYDEYYFTTQEIYGAYTSGLFTMGPEEGGTIFSIGSSGGAQHQSTTKFKWGVAPIPGSKLSDGTINNSAISQGPSICMFKSNTEKEKMAWNFLKMILEPEFQCSFSMTSGYNPVRNSSFEIDEYADFLTKTDNIVAVTAGIARQMGDRYYTSPAFVGSSVARTQVGAALVNAVTGISTPQKALLEAMQKCGA